MRHNVWKRLLVLSVICTILSSSLSVVHAATEKDYYSVKEFTALLLQAMNIKYESSLTKAKALGLYTDKEIFANNKKMTRGDAAILLNHADQYLYKDQYKIEKNMLQQVKYNTVTDIGPLGETRREACANVYSKGIMHAYVTETFSRTCAFKPTKTLTKAEAAEAIEHLVNPSLRFKLAPDGAMCKDPGTIERQDKFVSVLASIPDNFYNKLAFEQNSRWGTKEFGFKEDEGYAYPIGIRKITYTNSYASTNLGEMMDTSYDAWIDNLQAYLEHIFRVDYKKLKNEDDEWFKFFDQYVNTSDLLRVEVKNVYYNNDINRAKASIDFSKIYIDKDNPYFSPDGVHVRVYVKYKISTDLTDTKDLDERMDKILYCSGCKLNHCVYGEWSEAYFDIPFVAKDYLYGKGNEMGVSVFGSLKDYS